jgi:hypothetical protein
VKVNPFPIPKSFFLFGQEYTIEWVESLVQKAGAVGQSRARDHCIQLQPNREACPRPESDIEETYFHELTHTVLVAMGRDDLSEDEKFVDIFASLLHQSFVTSEYPKARGRK